MPLTPGTRLGPYEIAGSLGAGGMGEVYRAKDIRLGRTVAIKVLPADFAADPERKRRFEQEARAVSALSHPNIGALYDVGSAEIPGQAPVSYLVMEFLEGQSLAERLGKGPLPLREALETGAQVADALSKAHRQGIIHRDIKPGNIILTKEGAKLLDFGLAKARPAGADTGRTLSIGSTPITQAGFVAGTIPYMAPEQLEGRETDARTDIFAFGALLYEMVSGRRAFDGGSQASLIAAIMTSDPPALAELQPVTPPALDRLVRQCLAKDPDKRWQSAGDVARHLEGLLEELRFPSSASKMAVVAATRRSRVRRLAVISAGALAFAALAGGAYLIGRRGADRPLPTFRRLTFRRGTVQSAAFTSDGQSVFYTARWDGGPLESYSVRTDGVDSVLREGIRGYRVLGVSSANELALFRGYTLATAPLVGAAPRSLLTGITDAAWLPDGSGLAVVHDGVLECPAGNVIYRPKPDNPTLAGLSVSPKGDLIAFLEFTIGHGFVVIVDRSGRVKARSAFHDGLSTTAWPPSGREVWFTTDGEAVRAMDLKSRERSVLRSPRMLLQDVARDGRALLLLRDQTVRMNVKTPSDSSERDVSYYGWSLVEDISADGRTILFDEGGESNPLNGWAIFLRGTDGSPPQKLTDGYKGRISPDGKWVAAIIFPDRSSRSVFAFVPTGPGEPRPINVDLNQAIEICGWLPDSSGVTFMAGEGEKLRGWLARNDGTPPNPITGPGWWIGDPSPDGKYVVAENGVSEHPDGILYLYAVDGQSKIPLPIDPAQWGIYGWHDARHLRVGSNREGGLAGPDGLRLPRRIRLLDIQTGKDEPWLSFGADLPRAGLAGVTRFRASADGRSYVYDYSTNLGTLYISEGLR